MDRDRGGGFRPRNFAPVNVGDELDVKIEAVGEKGDGIAKKDGFVLFVPGVREGDNVKIRVTKVLRKVGFAEVVGSAKKKNKDEPSEETSEESSEEHEGESSEDSSEEEPSEDEPSEEEPSEDNAEDKPSEDTETFGEDLEEEK